MGMINLQDVDVENQNEDVIVTGTSTEKSVEGRDQTSMEEVGTKKLSDKKSWMTVLVGVLVVVIGVCSITIPITLNNRNNNDEKDTNANNVVQTDQNNSSSTTTTSKSSYFQTNGLFNSTIEVMSANVTQGYTSDKELEESIENAANFHLGIIYNQINMNSAATTTENEGNTANTEDSDLGESPAMSDGGSELTSDTMVKAPGDSFDTNNQEQGVEEGDLIVSDGDYVYAAYGKYLVVWNTGTGDMIKSFEMPPIEMNVTSNDTTSSSSSSSKSAFIDWYYEPEPYISSLLLHQGRLLVVVSGYEARNYRYTGTGVHTDDHVLYNYLSTNVRLYDTALLLSSADVSAESGLVGSKFVNGAWNAVRATNGIAHIVTMSGLNTDEYLVSPLQRLNLDASNISKDEFEQRIQQAAPTIRSSFTRKLMIDLQAGGDSLPSLSRINSWQFSHSENGTLEQLTYGSTGLLTSLVLVHSLDMMSSSLGSNSISTTSSGSFVPAYWVQVYGSNDRIILAASVYEYDEKTGSSKESTGLLAFDINGASATPTSVGSVPGYLLNSYAMDVVGTTLRIATTVRNQTWTMFDVVAVEASTKEGVASKDVASSDAIAVDVMPGFMTDFETENFIIIMEMPSGSSGDSALGTMVEVGRLQIGKPQESITSIRFFDNITYAVTFERTDPFYVLDLSNPTNPTILAELNITGFSNYLHPINPEKTVLLAVGEEADEQGVSLGLQITVFNVTDPRNPVALHRHSIEKDNTTYSYSDAQWDYKSFRYVDGYLFLPVDISVDWYANSTQEPFYGTMMFKISIETGIEEVVQCRVSHTEEAYYDEITVADVDVVSPDDASTSTSNGSSGSSGESSSVTRPCNYSGWLPRRSMVFDGDLMSIRNSQIIMTDLTTCSQEWSKTIAIPKVGGCTF